MVRPWQRKFLYAVTVPLWFSGVIWLALKYWFRSGSEFGPQTHPLQPVMLQIHGALAMAFLIALGSVLHHVQPGWKQQRRRISGVPLLMVCAILILTGWGLYYLGNEELRELVSIVHWVLGLCLPAIFFVHVITIVRRRLKQHQTPARVK